LPEGDGWLYELLITGQEEIERVFRALKDGDWLGWGPMYHWTDSTLKSIGRCLLGRWASPPLSRRTSVSRRRIRQPACGSACPKPMPTGPLALKLDGLYAGTKLADRDFRLSLIGKSTTDLSATKDPS
jgi:hypothetical protein